jgi:hypothetical protein
MRWAGGIAGFAALAFAVSCRSGPLELTEAHRTALADSIDQMVAHVLSGLDHPHLGAILDYYEKNDARNNVENGVIFPSFDSIAVAARQMGAGLAVRASFGEHHVLVLDRDVAVLTAVINGETTDSAGRVLRPVLGWTMVFHRTWRGWKIAASHESFPAHCPPPPARAGDRHGD